MIIDANEPLDQFHFVKSLQDHVHTFVLYAVVLQNYSVYVVWKLSQSLLKGSTFGLFQVVSL